MYFINDQYAELNEMDGDSDVEEKVNQSFLFFFLTNMESRT